jgi:F-box and WD-40 domain protein 1/11
MMMMTFSYSNIHPPPFFLAMDLHLCFDSLDRLKPHEQYLLYQLLHEKIQKRQRDPFQLFPAEVLHRILLLLPIAALGVLQLVSSRWKSTIDSISWKTVYIQQGWAWNPALKEPIDWAKMCKQRYMLEKNWKFGRYSMKLVSQHSDGIYCAFRHREHLFTGSRDRTIQCWTLDSDLNYIRSFIGHQASVLCVWANDHHLFSGSSDNTIIQWEIHTGVIKARYIGHSDSVLGIHVQDDLLVSCSTDQTIKLWDTHTSKIKKTLTGHTGGINAVRLAGNQVISASSDKTIKIWDVSNGDFINILGHNRGVVSLQVTVDRIISGSSGTLISLDGEIRIWTRGGDPITTIQAHTGLVRSLSASRHRFVSGSYDKSIRVWDLRTHNQVLHFLNTPQLPVVNVYLDDTIVVGCFVEFRGFAILNFTHGIDPEPFLL